MAQPTAQTDRDLTSISEARTLVRRARDAAPALAELTQEQIDAIVDAMAAAVTVPEAARRAGAPDGAINWRTTVTLEGTQELMKARETAVILATGGMGLVRAAYSAGKPAYGVGPGNAPAYMESTADVPKAVRDVVIGKT